jgi:hypothetical protein
MTAIWGPLGWMTLHSVATCYPESPTQSEKELMYSWLDMFRDTITCPHCREHFAGMLQTYRSSFPSMLNSRQEFSLFTFRAHNAVNRRLRKPIQGTLEDCMATLQNNVKTRTAADYRISYINHITRHWKSWQDVTGVVALKKIAEMRKIEMTYIQPRDTNFKVTLTPDVVVLPQDSLEPREGPVEPRGRGVVLPKGQPGARAGFRITAAGIRLR